jgi:hypothetical protein
MNLTYRVLLLQGEGIYCRTLLISEMGKENFQKFKSLKAFVDIDVLILGRNVKIDFA